MPTFSYNYWGLNSDPFAYTADSLQAKLTPQPKRSCNFKVFYLTNPGMVARTYSPSTQEAEVGGLLQIQGQSRFHSEFQVILSYGGKTLSSPHLSP